jgi:hypothetical protein
MPRQLTAVIDRRVAPHEAVQRFRERDARLATDTRTEGERWLTRRLGNPSWRRSSPARPMKLGFQN